MRSIASLVMSVIVNECNEEDESLQTAQPQKTKRLWGLVVCHHITPRFIPFPLRYACEFLIQVFSIHVNKELELQNQILVRKILRTQTLLCDLLMQNAPLGIVSASPNIMNLVKCDGAALLYNDKIWRLGVSPTDIQIHDIASWLSENYKDSTGVCTDSLLDAGYPHALSLGNLVCGMAAVWINTKDMLFWFRSHISIAIKWGGEKNELGGKDDESNIHPRCSFQAFFQIVRGVVSTAGIHSGVDHLNIEEVKESDAVSKETIRLIETATAPIFAVDVCGMINGWNAKTEQLTGVPIDQVMGKHLLTFVEDSSSDIVNRMLHLALQGKEEHNVQFDMKTHGPGKDTGPVSLIVNACTSKDYRENFVGVCFIAQDMTSQKIVMDKFTNLAGAQGGIKQ
ncbi:hypothetical protein GIB67_018450 [Kingdonia uniflora]|uniref:Phytochrome A n=1 Tax=Kingdonia uniflora TaxID=39325 RepID=A0A7J7LJK0_9MAGN|nr:hypothetical protein GIB67_018450 [Kingdonia uniflora]